MGDSRISNISGVGQDRLLLLRALAWLIVGLSALVVFLNIPIFYQYVIDNSQLPVSPPKLWLGYGVLFGVLANYYSLD